MTFLYDSAKRFSMFLGEFQAAARGEPPSDDRHPENPTNQLCHGFCPNVK